MASKCANPNALSSVRKSDSNVLSQTSTYQTNNGARSKKASSAPNVMMYSMQWPLHGQLADGSIDPLVDFLRNPNWTVSDSEPRSFTERFGRHINKPADH